MPTEKYKKVFELNKKWVEEKNKKDEKYFNKIYSEAQHPEFLYIGCSDSRVPANTITGLDVGDLFVHRNIANVVSNNDLNIMSVIQYAVENLKVKHIVVCGHYGCGGVQAASQHKSYGLLDSWLKNIRDVHREYFDELEAITDEDEKFDRLVELNVIEQAANVIKSSYVQKSYNDDGFPTVHGWVYNMKDGKLIDLNIDYKNIMKEVKKVYNIG